MTAATSRIGPDAGAWSRDEFVRQLRNVLEQRYHHLHPFNRRMHHGELSRDELQLWVANRFYYQINIPIKDALILSNCPEPEVRRAWIQRIIDHDGRPGEEGGIEAWLRLGHAMGVRREDLLTQRRLLPGVRFAVDGYVNFCRSQPWLEAVAASLTELFAPLIVQERLAAMLSHCRWVDPDGLQYFKNRLSQARRQACAGARHRAAPHPGAAAARGGGARIQVRRAVVPAGRRGARTAPGRRPVNPAPTAAVPRLHPKARLQRDDVRQRDVLLYPEGLVTLNPTGAEILALCDGVRSLADIVAALEQRYAASGLERDVMSFLDGLAAKGLVIYGR